MKRSYGPCKAIEPYIDRRQELWRIGPDFKHTCKWQQDVEFAKVEYRLARSRLVVIAFNKKKKPIYATEKETYLRRTRGDVIRTRKHQAWYCKDLETPYYNEYFDMIKTNKLMIKLGVQTHESSKRRN